MTEPKQYPQGFAREREREIIRYKKRVDRLVHDLWLCKDECEGMRSELTTLRALKARLEDAHLALQCSAGNLRDLDSITSYRLAVLEAP